MKRFLKIIASTLILLMSMISPINAFATDDSSEQLISYIAQLVGYSENDISILYDEFDDMDSFLNEVDNLLSDIIIAEQWDNSDTSIESLNEISLELGVNVDLLQRHINICGEEYFSKRIYSYSAMPLSAGGGSNSAISASLFEQFYNNAHTGNIFLTKDSVSANYRHGHTGIVSSHTSNAKKIVEALGNRDDPEDEVVERSLRNWNTRVTLAIYYPSNTTTDQRESAGNYAKQLKDGTYTPLVTKKTAQGSSKKMNCISLVYKAYASIYEGYDLVPQVASLSYLYPSQIQFSPIISLKSTSDGMLRTSNWNDYDWGW